MMTSKHRATILLPVNPVPASRPRVTRWGAYYGKNYTQWRKAVDEWLEKFMSHSKFQTISTPVSVSLGHHVLKPKTSKRSYPRGDIDNYDKAALDAIVKHKLLVDDDLVLQLHSYKTFSNKDEQEGTRITITIL